MYIRRDKCIFFLVVLSTKKHTVSLLQPASTTTFLSVRYYFSSDAPPILRRAFRWLFKIIIIIKITSPPQKRKITFNRAYAEISSFFPLSLSHHRQFTILGEIFRLVLSSLMSGAGGPTVRSNRGSLLLLLSLSVLAVAFCLRLNTIWSS